MSENNTEVKTENSVQIENQVICKIYLYLSENIPLTNLGSQPT